MNTTQYNKCVEAQADNLYRFILGIVKHHAQAEDIIQESFARMWENRAKVELGKEKSYLFTIAYRLAISELRSHKKMNSDEIPITHFAPNEEYDNLTELLWQALDTLSPTGRSTIMLCDWEGYTYNEIAEIMQMSLAQVKITIHRSRNEIKEKLQNEYRA